MTEECKAQLARLKEEIEGASNVATHARYEDARKAALDKLDGYSREIWKLAANEPKAFAEVKALDDMIAPLLATRKGSGSPGPRVKQPAPPEVKTLLAGIVWDGIGRIDDEKFWKKLFGSAAVSRDGSPAGEAARAFMAGAIRRLFEPGIVNMPLILIGESSADIAARMSPPRLPSPYRTSVGHLVPSRASFVTVFDGLGESTDRGPFARQDETKEGEKLDRWFSSVAFIKRPTTLADRIGYILCQGETFPGDVDMDQAWAEMYRQLYDK